MMPEGPGSQPGCNVTPQACQRHIRAVPGSDGLMGIFTDNVRYCHSPYEELVVGLDSISLMRDEDRADPIEVFTLATEILAVDGATAIVRAEVRYGNPVRQEYRDLSIMQI